MSALARCPEPVTWPVRDLACGFETRRGHWTDVQGRLIGPSDGPASIVLGGVSAGRRLAPDGDGEGWWPGVAAPNGALDPARRRLLAADFLDDRVAPFPTIEDQADAVLALADAAGLEQFDLVGASYGGMVALAIAATASHRVRRLDVLCAAPRPSAMATAWRSIQREILQLALDAGEGARGVDLARRLAMTTYRTCEEFSGRFNAPEPDSRDQAGVEAYLAARGAAYAQTVSPERYLALSQSMDSADIAVDSITARTRFLAIRSDLLVPAADIQAAASRIAGAEVTQIDSLYGHDGFLKEVDAVNRFLEAGR